MRITRLITYSTMLCGMALAATESAAVAQVDFTEAMLGPSPSQARARWQQRVLQQSNPASEATTTEAPRSTARAPQYRTAATSPRYGNSVEPVSSSLVEAPSVTGETSLLQESPLGPEPVHFDPVMTEGSVGSMGMLGPGCPTCRPRRASCVMRPR